MSEDQTPLDYVESLRQSFERGLERSLSHEPLGVAERALHKASLAVPGPLGLKMLVLSGACGVLHEGCQVVREALSQNAPLDPMKLCHALRDGAVTRGKAILPTLAAHVVLARLAPKISVLKKLSHLKPS